jgi:NADH:ubiquinone oxidoreductase subunit 3 (subunit A)
MFGKFSTFFFKQLRENILHCPLPLCYIIAQRRKRGDRRLLADYGYIAILTVVAISIPALILFLAKALSAKPKQPDPEGVKTETYECGMKTVGSSWLQFNFRYYFYAILFVVFDIEAVFLYPWAVKFKELGFFGFVEMLVFIFILAIGLVYAWKKKVMEWK